MSPNHPSPAASPAASLTASPPCRPAPELAAWRNEVGRFRAASPRRILPLGVQVGVPLGDRLAVEVPWPAPATYDHGLRFDLLVTLVERWARGGHRAGFGWLTRPGVPEVHDVDLLWLAAASRAFGARGVDLLGFLVLTRSGWIDVRSGERRTWKRLRL